MKSPLIASIAVASLLAGSSAFAFGSNPAKEQCKVVYQQELSAAKAQHTHAERKASQKLAKAHYKDCKHQAKH